MRVGGFNLNQMGDRQGERLLLRGQEREKYEMVAKGIKGYRSERELGMLSVVALGGNNRKKSGVSISQRPLEVKDADSIG